MRILHVIPNIERGGAERVMITLAKAAVKAGHEVTIVVLGCLNEYTRETEHFPLLKLGWSVSYRSPVQTAKCLNKLRSVLRQYKPNIIHSHLWPAAQMVGWARSQTSIPHIVHIHAPVSWLVGSDLRSRLIRYLTKHATNRKMTYFIAAGRNILQQTRERLPWIPEESEVFYNCFDEELFHGSVIPRSRSQTQSLVIGMAARLVENKGIDWCLKVLSSAHISRPWTCLVAGDGSMRERWEHLARQLGLSQQVRFLGTVEDMARFYSRVDLFIQPSFSEGLSVVVIEAMASGVAVVATDVGSTREAIRDRIDGFLVRAGDTEALKRALECLANNDALRDAIARAAYDHAWTSFCSHNVTTKLLEYYKTLTSSALTSHKPSN